VLKTSQHLFRSAKGQALAELILIIPLILFLLNASRDFRIQWDDRLARDTQQLDHELKKFVVSTSLSLKQKTSIHCLPWNESQSDTFRTRWPVEVDHQRALSLAASRAACLAEATARLGPEIALPLWALHLQSATESVAQASARTLCPRVKTLGEQLRHSISQTHRLRIPRDLSVVAQLKARCLTGHSTLY